jgi:hypothetical protein
LGSEPLELTEKSAAEILDRFGDFHDAVVRLVQFDVEHLTARVELDAQDGAADWEWRRVRFDFQEAEEWRFERINTAIEIIFEASVHWFDDLVFVSFEGDRRVTETAIEEARSAFYVAARHCECAISDLLQIE